jgi:hypothetical protein
VSDQSSDLTLYPHLADAGSAGADSLPPRLRGESWGEGQAALDPLRRWAATLAFLALATPAEAGPRSIDDCESIKDANAYNLCLASFGPMRGQHGATYPGAASEGEKRGRSASGPGRRPAPRLAAPPLPRGARVSHGGNGRIRMEFTP